jgi:cyclohexadienyl dehydratase
MGGIARKPARALAGMLSIPYLEFGKTAAVRASDRGKYRTLADINKPGVVAVSNPGGMIALHILLHTQEKSASPEHEVLPCMQWMIRAVNGQQQV